MRLETVEKLTRDRDLAKRHIAFLTAEHDHLKQKKELTADEQLRLQETEIRLSDCTLYLAQLEPQLEKAVSELAQKIRALDNENFSLILFERYILLKPMKLIATTLGLNQTAIYAAHTAARDAYNKAHNISCYKDARGRKAKY